MRISRDRLAEWEHASLAHGLQELVPDRDYSELNVQDEQLRIWLPDVAKTALEALAERDESSMTVYLTEFFASYLYGYHELLRMRESRIGLYEPKRYKSSMMGAEAEPMPSLGKNIFAIKIFLPEKMKADLQSVAGAVALTLGECVRRLICSHLFGRMYGIPDLQVVCSQVEQTRAIAWEKSVELTEE